MDDMDEVIESLEFARQMISNLAKRVEKLETLTKGLLNELNLDSDELADIDAGRD